jgi:SM-20-related protein
MTQPPPLRLNPKLDPKDYASTYAETGMIQVPDIFEPETAQTIFSILARNTPWRLVHSDENGKHVMQTPEELRAMGPQVLGQLSQKLHGQARENFAYIYHTYPMLEAYLYGWDPGHPLHAVFEFMNSNFFLDFIREVTGEDQVIKVDAQATLYTPGHFLTNHDDSGDNKERRAAYTLGFSQGWKPDWGGNLVFYEEDDPSQIIQTLLPGWNVLSMFRVPRPHSVTYVTPFAGTGRYSITGWLRDDPGPGAHKGAE